jgi:hypothetical protein
MARSAQGIAIFAPLIMGQKRGLSSAKPLNFAVTTSMFGIPDVMLHGHGLIPIPLSCCAYRRTNTPKAITLPAMAPAALQPTSRGAHTTPQRYPASVLRFGCD